MKFGMGVTTLTRTFQFSVIGNNNMVDTRTCEVEATLAPLNIGP
jgi:hypothetical protein